MNKLLILVLLIPLLILAKEKNSKDLLDSISGVYKPKFKITVFNSATGKEEESDAENIYEIVPISDNAAYVKIKKITTNAHRCSIQGIFEYDHDNSFRFVDPDYGCKMIMTVDDSKISFDDPEGHCRAFTCGNRLGYDGYIERKLKRKIRYMDIIKKSPEYIESVEYYNGRTKSEK